MRKEFEGRNRNGERGYIGLKVKETLLADYFDKVKII